MRFPVDPPAPVGAADDLYEVQAPASIAPFSPLGPRPQPPNPPLRREPPERDASEDTRTLEDRRKKDRRQYVQAVLVDTRLGRDRRHARRRPTDPPPPSIDEKA